MATDCIDELTYQTWGALRTVVQVGVRLETREVDGELRDRVASIILVDEAHQETSLESVREAAEVLAMLGAEPLPLHPSLALFPDLHPMPAGLYQRLRGLLVDKVVGRRVAARCMYPHAGSHTIH